MISFEFSTSQTSIKSIMIKILYNQYNNMLEVIYSRLAIEVKKAHKGIKKYLILILFQVYKILAFKIVIGQN